MTVPTRIYLINFNNHEWAVEATSQAQAVMHIARAHIESIKVATAVEIARHYQRGLKVEVAAPQKEEEPAVTISVDAGLEGDSSGGVTVDASKGEIIYVAARHSGSVVGEVGASAPQPDGGGGGAGEAMLAATTEVADGLIVRAQSGTGEPADLRKPRARQFDNTATRRKA